MTDNNYDISSRKVLQQAERLNEIALEIEKNRESLSECSKMVSSSWKGDNAVVYLGKAEAFSYGLKEMSDGLINTAEEIRQAVSELSKDIK